MLFRSVAGRLGRSRPCSSSSPWHQAARRPWRIAVADPSGGPRRLRWLDLYKGLAILLVVLGHMNIPARASQLIYSFHVPLFFIASGYVMALGRPTAIRTFLARRWRSLIVPYLVFSLLGLLALLPMLPPGADQIGRAHV